jgi:hypothetical protein
MIMPLKVLKFQKNIIVIVKMKNMICVCVCVCVCVDSNGYGFCPFNHIFSSY